MPDHTKKKKKIAWNSSSLSLSSVPIPAFKEIYSGFKWNSSSMNSSSMQFFIFIFKFDRPKPIVVFRETYSSVSNGTRAPWTRVPCFSFFFFFFFKFDLPKPIIALRKIYSGVLNGTRAPWTQVPCKFVCLFVCFFN